MPYERRSAQPERWGDAELHFPELGKENKMERERREGEEDKGIGGADEGPGERTIHLDPQLDEVLRWMRDTV